MPPYQGGGGQAHLWCDAPMPPERSYCLTHILLWKSAMTHIRRRGKPIYSGSMVECDDPHASGAFVLLDPYTSIEECDATHINGGQAHLWWLYGGMRCPPFPSHGRALSQLY